MPRREHYLLEPDAVRLLKEYSVPYPTHDLARNADQAVQISEKLGFPVILKIVSPEVVHKSDAGGVLVGLENTTQVREGFATLVGRVTSAVPGARIEGVLVCEQADPGFEVIVGALEDATFGPTVMFGLGGIYAEVLRDVTFRIAPLSRQDAVAMVEEIQGYSLLTGVRGQTPCDLKALADLLLSVSRLITNRRDVKELDLNPVRLYERGLLVLDARMVTKR